MKKAWAEFVGDGDRRAVPLGTAFLGIGVLALVGSYVDGPMGLILGGVLLAVAVGASAWQREQPLGDTLRSARSTERNGEARSGTHAGQRHGSEGDRGSDTRRRVETLEAERDQLRARCEELESELDRERRRRIGQEKLLEALTQVSRECADGTLSMRLDEDVITEYLSDTSGRILDEGAVEHELPVAFNAMLDEFESTIREVDSFVSLVSQTGEGVVDRTETVERASQQISDRMDTIATGADEQSARLRAAESEMEQLSENIRTIGGLLADVASAAEQTVDTGHEGREAAKEAIHGMREIESGAGEAVDAIETLHEEMRAIDDLVESISNLAGQTNMLALNANIEASRSTKQRDESGEGFGVVASEVKQLAEKSQQTAEAIEERIERLQAESETATETVREVERKMATHAESIETALRALDEITSHAEATNDGIQQIGTATKAQATSTDEVVSLVHQTARISENTSKATEHTRSTTVKQAETLGTVTDQATDLTAAADRLKDTLAVFADDSTPPPEATIDAVTDDLADRQTGTR
jgi:methyl-accepting chemotaxis protein